MRQALAIIGCMLLLGVGVLLIGKPRAVRGLSMPRQNPATFTPTQWKDTFTLAAELPLTQRIAFWADLAAIDAMYVADPLGEGPGQAPDADPRSDFARVDCVTYTEQVYAMALSTAREQALDTLQRIRYTEGKIDFRWRNHYTVADWLPANRWFIRDVTDEVGGNTVTPMSKTIARGAFFAGKGLPQYADLPDEILTTNYIPRARVGEVSAKLRTGDLAILVINTPGIVAGHVGIIRVEPNGVFLQHASLTAKRVVKVPLTAYFADAPARFVGFKVARPSEPAPR